MHQIYLILKKCMRYSVSNRSFTKMYEIQRCIINSLKYIFIAIYKLTIKLWSNSRLQTSSTSLKIYRSLRHFSSNIETRRASAESPDLEPRKLHFRERIRRDVYLIRGGNKNGVACCDRRLLLWPEARKNVERIVV